MNLFRSLFYSKQESRVAPVMSALFTGAGSSGLFSGGNIKYKTAATEGYKSIVWVYRCIAELGQAVGSVPWRAYAENPDENPNAKPLPNHPLASLMNQPNPYQDRSEFLTTWMTHLSLGGNSYWEKVFVNGYDTQTGKKSGKKLKYLYALRPDYITPVPDPKTFIKGYLFDAGTAAGKVTFDPPEILHFKYVDPLNDYVGMSPLTAAARTLDTDNAAIGWNKSILDNFGVPGGVLKVPAQTMLNEDKKILQEEITSEFTGDNRHRPLVLWGGMEWSQMALSQADMQFLEQRKLNKYELCAVLGVPPQIVGANEDPTYSNYSVARLSFWEDTIIPLLDWIKGKVNSQIAPYFGEGVWVSYDISKVPAFRESFTQLVQTAERLFKMNLPVNAINARLGLGFDPVPWGDTAWVPMNLVPIGEAPDDVEAAPNPNPPEDDEDEDDIDPATGEPLDDEDEDESGGTESGDGNVSGSSGVR